jgi:hypothetical protein
MTTEPRLSPAEEKLLSCLGYLVARWNYVEHCTRQILRMYAEGESIDDPDHLRISSHVAVRIEQELKKVAATHWTGVGKPYLDSLIAAYEVAREHRNHLVHGIYMTFGASGPFEAHAVLVPAKPIDRRSQVPSYVKLSELLPVAEHVHELAMFAREVMVGFDASGNRALNANGTPVLAALPSLIVQLPPCKYLTTDIGVA